MSTIGHERCLPRVIAKLAPKKAVKVITDIAPQNKLSFGNVCHTLLTVSRHSHWGL